MKRAEKNLRLIQHNSLGEWGSNWTRNNPSENIDGG